MYICIYIHTYIHTYTHTHTLTHSLTHSLTHTQALVVYFLHEATIKSNFEKQVPCRPMGYGIYEVRAQGGSQHNGRRHEMCYDSLVHRALHPDTVSKCRKGHVTGTAGLLYLQ